MTKEELDKAWEEIEDLFTQKHEIERKIENKLIEIKTLIIEILEKK